MDAIFYQELAKHSEEIASGKDVIDSEREELITLTGVLEELAYTARRDGLLALEGTAGELPDDGMYSCLREMCMHVVDGMNPEVLKELAYMYYFSRRMVAYKALSYLVCLSSVLSIQAGEYPGLTEMKILSMIPEEDIYDCQVVMETVKPMRLSPEEKMEQLFEGDISIKPDNPDYDMIKMADDLFAEMDERTAGLLLRSLENNSIVVMMKGLSGAARKIILTNVSGNLASMLIEDMDYMGPVRQKDVSEKVREALGVYVRLLEGHEIWNEDPAIGRRIRVILQKEEE